MQRAHDVLAPELGAARAGPPSSPRLAGGVPAGPPPLSPGPDVLPSRFHPLSLIPWEGRTSFPTRTQPTELRG